MRDGETLQALYPEPWTGRSPPCTSCTVPTKTTSGEGAAGKRWRTVVLLHELLEDLLGEREVAVVGRQVRPAHPACRHLRKHLEAVHLLAYGAQKIMGA